MCRRVNVSVYKRDFIAASTNVETKYFTAQYECLLMHYELASVNDAKFQVNLISLDKDR